MGSGEQVMLFAHGFIGDQTLWRYVSKHFEKNYKVVLFDYVGSGQSDRSAYDRQRYSTLEGYAEDVLEICESLQIRECIFVGHSISSIIGLIAAMRRPELFSALVLVAPSPRYINDVEYFGGFEKSEIDKMLRNVEENYEQWAKGLAPKVMNQPDAPELSDELIQKLLSTDHRIAVNFAKTTFFTDYRQPLLKFKLPALILQCSDDIMAPVEVGDYLHAHLHNSTLRKLEAKGHFPQLSAPGEVVRVITEYLKKP